MDTVATFSIRFTRFLGADGNLVPDSPDFVRDREQVVSLYRGLVQTRSFDAKAIALQRTGQLGTYASSLGQEAIGVGLGAAMQEDDVLVPDYRQCGAQFARGVAMEELLLYWGGDERGSNYAVALEDLPVTVPVGSQAGLAVGVAAAFKYRNEPRAVVVTCGDGGTSKGDFYEALNVAGAWQLPVVFVVNNNQWAISVPRSAQTACETIAQKAIAGGLPGVQVDGNDVFAVRHIMGELLQRARSGEGPALLEALSYRLGDHTTADDAGRYRPASDVSSHWAAEPLVRIRNYLVSEFAWSKADEEALIQSINKKIDAAVEVYLATPPQSVETIFDHLYAELPEAYSPQRAAAIARGTRHD